MTEFNFPGELLASEDLEALIQRVGAITGRTAPCPKTRLSLQEISKGPSSTSNQVHGLGRGPSRGTGNRWS